MDYVYSCLLECDNTACKEIVSSSGVGYTEQYIVCDEEGEGTDYQDYFSPKYFSPHLKIFNYQKNIPDEITEELENSFSLFFCDPPSSANHIRMALENLLNHMKIRKYRIQKKGGRSYLSLHERINSLPQKYHDIQELFTAVKWLGNAGSHSGATVSSDDVLDAYELMEHLLTEIFNEERKKNLKALAQTINKKKGPTTKSGLA